MKSKTKPVVTKEQKKLMEKAIYIYNSNEVSALLTSRARLIGREFVYSLADKEGKRSSYWAYIYAMDAVQYKDGPDGEKSKTLDTIFSLWVVYGGSLWRTESLREVVEILDAIRADEDLNQWLDQEDARQEFLKEKKKSAKKGLLKAA